MAEPAPLLELRDVAASFGGIRALAGVSFRVAPGEFVGLIGPNGCGKTTLFNCVSGAARHRGGSIRFDGRPIDRVPAFRRARLGIRRTFQNTALFESMSALDNVRLGADWRVSGNEAGGRSGEIVGQLVNELGLGPFASTPVRHLSTGYRKRVEIARAIAGGARLLLLDEPLAGILPRDVDAIMETLRRLHQSTQLSILLVEHEVRVVTSLADRLIAMDFGRIIADGSTEDVRNSAAVRTAYLGGTA